MGPAPSFIWSVWNTKIESVMPFGVEDANQTQSYFKVIATSPDTNPLELRKKAVSRLMPRYNKKIPSLQSIVFDTYT